MSVLTHDRTVIEDFRDELKRYGTRLTENQAWDVLRTVGDRGLALDAMLMSPRPEWLVALAGPLK